VAEPEREHRLELVAGVRQDATVAATHRIAEIDHACPSEEPNATADLESQLDRKRDRVVEGAHRATRSDPRAEGDERCLRES
jgi:hypothetical protein